jgi:hypothetical protein
MADQERDIHIPFNSGFDDFTDDRWKPDGRISTITNAEWNQEGRLEKRRGFEAFTESGVTVGALAQYGSTFVSLSQDHLAIYNPQQDSMTKTRVGTFLDVQTYSAASVPDVGEPQVSIAYNSNIYMVAWSQYSDGDLYACFYDSASKRPLTEVYKVDTGTFTNVTAHAYNGFFAIVASDADTGGQYVYRNPTVLPVHDNWTIETLGTAFTHADDIDAYADDDTIYIVGHPNGVTSDVRVIKTLISVAGVISTTDLPWVTRTTQWNINPVDVGFGIVGVLDATGGLIFCTIDSTPAVLVPNDLLGFANANHPVIGASGDPTYPLCVVFMQDTAFVVDMVMICFETFGLTSIQKRCGASEPMSQPWVDSVTDDLLWVSRTMDPPPNTAVADRVESLIQNVVTMVTRDELRNYEVIDAYRVGFKTRFGQVGLQTNTLLSSRPVRTTDVTATKRAWPTIAKVQTQPSSFVIQIVEAESAPAVTAKGQELANGLYTSRGANVFDGLQLHEVGFIRSPIRFSRIDSPGGSLSAGDYLYSSTYEVQNALGDTMRSAPSIEPKLAVSALDQTDGTYFTPPMTNWGVRFDRGTNPYIVQYRSVVNQESLFKTKPQDDLDQSMFNLTAINDQESDADIVDNGIIYTDGAQMPPVEAVCPPCFVDMCVYKNRVIGVGDDGITLWVSTDKRITEQVRFNEAMNVQIADGGRIYAIAAEQDRFICFKENDIYVVYGEGADERAVGASFNLPIPLAQNLGCTRPESVIATPVGTFFQGGPGIMRIVGPNVDFIGNAVRDTFPGNVTAVAHSPEQQKVFFGCCDDDLTEFMILVYDYRFNRWTKWTYTHPSALTGENLKIIGMAVYDNRLHCALGDRTYIIRQKLLSSASSHLDYTNTWVTMEVEFAPIKTSGPQGFQHVKKVMVIGEQGSRHNLSVSFANDYDSSYYQTVNWSAAVIDTWTTLPLEQFSAKPGRPRCEAIKVKINDATPSTGAQGTGQGLKLVGLSLTVANKTRLMRLGSPYKR